METWIVLIVLASALMHAVWNAVVKSGGDRLMTLVSIKLPNMAMAALMLLFVAPLPRWESWPYLLAATGATCGYYVCLLRAYHANDFNIAYPIARGAAPALTLALSVAFTADRLTPGAALGAAIVSLGICALAFRPGLTRQNLTGLLWALGVAATIATYTVIDGIGARVSGDALGYTAVLNLLTGIPVLTAGFYRHGPRCFNQLRQAWLTSIFGGSLMFFAYAIVVFALTRAPIAPVAALRETGVIFGAIIGAVLFKEQMAIRRIAAAIVVAAGVAMIIVWR